ncbi:hypothetical protein Cantr_00148 [Candida viswanathii]|uniref:Uncharacterized protein n=1 Tax=Candida viswanathii TaxID=5486 RepID=A0A367YHQ1_9ASCO|nr:hypothetical protein Cantr_00148 [Candida viswanathii]
MSVQTTTRRCSIGIESPESGRTNTPLNAFLIYTTRPQFRYPYDGELSPPLAVNSPPSSRRVSICDLHNFDDDDRQLEVEVEHEGSSMVRVLLVVLVLLEADDRSSSSSSHRKHRRRQTTALRFLKPRVL